MTSTDGHTGDTTPAATEFVKKRTRASVACNNCRTKRSKVPPVLCPSLPSAANPPPPPQCDGAVVGTPCSQCSKYNLRCELRRDRKRQRPSSAVLVEDLTERVKMLERLLNMSKQSLDSAAATATAAGPAAPDAQASGGGPASAASSSFPEPREPHEPDVAPVFPSSEDSDPDMSLSESALFDLDGLDTMDTMDNLDGLDVIGSTEDDMLGWGLDSICGESVVDVDVVSSSRRRSVPAPPPPPPPPISSSLPSSSMGPPPRPVDDAPVESAKKRKPSFAREWSGQAAPQAAPPAASQAGPTTAPTPATPVPDAVADLLLDLYFTQFQTLLAIIDEPSFRRAGRATCRESLLLAMMAAGARFLDDTASSLAEYTTRAGESVLIRRSKALLESEVGRADIMTVQALLILGELETSAGNDMSGCMYSGESRSRGQPPDQSAPANV